MATLQLKEVLLAAVKLPERCMVLAVGAMKIVADYNAMVERTTATIDFMFLKMRCESVQGALSALKVTFASDRKALNSCDELLMKVYGISQLCSSRLLESSAPGSYTNPIVIDDDVHIKKEKEEDVEISIECDETPTQVLVPNSPSF